MTATRSRRGGGAGARRACLARRAQRGRPGGRRQALSDVPYLDVSNYLDVPSGNRNLKVNAAGTATTVIDADADLAAGGDYTVIASGLVARDRAARAGGRQQRAGGRQRAGAGDPWRAERAGRGHLRHGARSGPQAAAPALTNVAFGDVLRLPRGAGGHLSGQGDAGRDEDGGHRQRPAHAGERPGSDRDRGGRGRWRRPFGLLLLEDLN